MEASYPHSSIDRVSRTVGYRFLNDEYFSLFIGFQVFPRFEEQAGILNERYILMIKLANAIKFAFHLVLLEVDVFQLPDQIETWWILFLTLSCNPDGRIKCWAFQSDAC